MKKILAAILTLLFLIVSLPVSAAPYNSYTFDYWDKAAESPDGYVPVKAVYGADFGVGALNAPEDMNVDKKTGNIYIADTKNNRIICLDGDFNLLKILSEVNKGGEASPLNTPRGVFFAGDGLLYIADTGNARIIAVDSGGNVVREMTAPDSGLLDGLEFKPINMVVDRSQAVFVLCEGINQGLLAFDAKGLFSGFYGSNPVEVTLQLLTDRFWKSIMSREQQGGMADYVPVEYSGLHIDGEDFIYAASKSLSVSQLKKMNPKGVNVLPAKRFGDLEIAYVNNSIEDTKFTDICAGEDGTINGLDAQRGRVFQYDRECNLLFIFGGIGDQTGTFKAPAAVDSYGDFVYVLDSAKNSVTLFQITRYGQYVKEAVALYNDGYYEEAIEPWREVLKRNANNELAYSGIGRAQMKLGQYRQAMESLKKGANQTAYSEAFSEYRNELIRTYFTSAAVTLAVVIALAVLLFKIRRRKRGKK